MSDHKNMQDDTPNSISCSKCGRTIVSASRVHSYRQRDIDSLVAGHKCVPSREAKKDFEEEIG